ncbi:MAG TPA: hypothetical protein VFV52_05530 [Bacilli bacterium]|nr:hypothetical protein [Bacilli bacterium]
MKKMAFGLTAVALASTLAFMQAPSTAHAGAGSWDFKWSGVAAVGDVYTNFDYPVHVINSGGGDFKVKVTGNTMPNDTLYVALYETDDGGNTGRLIDSKPLYGGTGDVIFSGLSNYVDGTNNYAEIVVKMKKSGSGVASVSAEFYD